MRTKWAVVVLLVVAAGCSKSGPPNPEQAGKDFETLFQRSRQNFGNYGSWSRSFDANSSPFKGTITLHAPVGQEFHAYEASLSYAGGQWKLNSVRSLAAPAGPGALAATYEDMGTQGLKKAITDALDQ
jgi:hypothetical protein